MDSKLEAAGRDAGECGPRFLAVTMGGCSMGWDEDGWIVRLGS